MSVSHSVTPHAASIVQHVLLELGEPVLLYCLILPERVDKVKADRTQLKGQGLKSPRQS